jgi:hypothetical protein
MVHCGVPRSPLCRLKIASNHKERKKGALISVVSRPISRRLLGAPKTHGRKKTGTGREVKRKRKKNDKIKRPVTWLLHWVAVLEGDIHSTSGWRWLSGEAVTLLTRRAQMTQWPNDTDSEECSALCRVPVVTNRNYLGPWVWAKKTTGKVAVDFLVLNNECISINHLILPWLSELLYQLPSFFQRNERRLNLFDFVFFVVD